MILVLHIALAVENICTMGFHVLGSYLLSVVYKNGNQDPRHYLLIHLSVTEGVVNFLQFLLNPVWRMVSMNPSVVEKCQDYILLIRGYGFVIVYYVTMIYIALDRLLDIMLNIKYHLYCDEIKAKYMMGITWVITAVVTTVASLLHAFLGLEMHAILFLYIHPTLDIIFVVIACVTYSLIFREYKKIRLPPGTNKSMRQPSILQVFRRSRFYVSTLLIATFVLFMVIPEMVHVYIFSIMDNRGNQHGHVYADVNTACRICFSLGYLSDVFIYVFMEPPVKQLLLKTLGVRRVNIAPINQASVINRTTSL